MKAIDSSRSVGRIVREARKAKNITQRQLALRAGVSERLVLALELGDATGIRLDKLLHVLSALDLTLGIVGANVEDAPSRAPVPYASVSLPDLDYDLPKALRFASLEDA